MHADITKVFPPFRFGHPTPAHRPPTAIDAVEDLAASLRAIESQLGQLAEQLYLVYGSLQALRPKDQQ